MWLIRDFDRSSECSDTETDAYLDVLMVGQAGRNAGQSVVVKVQFSQVGGVGQRAVFHRADLIVAQTQPSGRKTKQGNETCEKHKSTISINSERVHLFSQRQKL